MRITRVPARLLSLIAADADLDMLGTYQVKNLAAPASGEALRKGNADIANAEVAAAAAIAYSKLALTGSIVNADVAAAAAIAYSKLALTGSIVNADVAAAAAIAYSKLALTGSIVNADVAAAAAIAYSKLALTGSIVNADVAAAAAIVTSKLAWAGEFKIVRKTADETVNNSATLQNDDHLLFAIAANEVWEFIFILNYLSGTTPDIIFALTVPTGATLRAGVSDFVNLYSGVTLASGNYLMFMGDGTTDGTNNVIAVLHGYVVNGATAGNVQLQWAQNTATVSNTKVMTGSCLIAHKLG